MREACDRRARANAVDQGGAARREIELRYRGARRVEALTQFGGRVSTPCRTDELALQRARTIGGEPAPTVIQRDDRAAAHAGFDRAASFDPGHEPRSALIGAAREPASGLEHRAAAYDAARGRDSKAGRVGRDR